jgi:glycosyltransferase involved in cell wall biosynthesis
MTTATVSAAVSNAVGPTSAQWVPGRVSCLLVTYNRRELLLKCLRSCASQSYPDIELVVVENACSDGTAEAVREQFPSARLIQMHRNIGFFPALNVAIANSTGEYLMTVDDDAYFLFDDALEQMVSALVHDNELAGVTCNIVGPREQPPREDDEYVPSFKTGFAMLRRRVFTEWVGFYPDAFFRSGGEEYVSTALWEMNRGLKRLAGVRMYHDQTAIGRSSWDQAFHGQRSQLLVTLMRYPWYIVPARLASKFARGSVQAMRKRGVVGALAWLSAWLNVWLYLPYAWRLRQPISWQTWRRLRDMRPA